MHKHFLIVWLAAATIAMVGSAVAQSGEEEWTDESFPSYIRRIAHFGQRADWSHDGKRILFMGKTYGDVYEADLESGVITAKTHHYYHNGYTRALYLSNGDIVLAGSRTFDPEHHSDARRKTAELWVLSKKGDAPPVPLGELCSEGVAVSRRNLKIAWAIDHDNYPDKLPEGASQMWVGELDYSGGQPKLKNKKLVLDTRKVGFEAELETQNFVGAGEKALTFAAYGYQGTEAMTVDIETGEVTNHSNAPVQYDEPEGIFPDGKHTLVECDKHTGPNFQGSKHIDLYKLALDGSGNYQRLTYFNKARVYKASNPVVSDDGRFIAFQVPKSEWIAGIGKGLYIMDLEAAGLR